MSRLEPSERDRRVLSVDAVAFVSLIVFSLVVAVDALWYDLTLVRAGTALGLFAVVPGALFLVLSGFGPRLELRWLLYSVGTSLLLVMAVGLVLNLAFPPLGIQNPLSAPILGSTHAAVLIALTIAVRFSDPECRYVTIPSRRRIYDALAVWFRPETLAPLLLPPLAILSVVWLNRTGDNTPLLALLVLVALVPLSIVRGWIPERWYSLAIWTAGLALLWHKTLWQFYTYRGQANIVTAWKVGRWSITERGGVQAATTPLLPNVTVSPTFAHLGDIHVLTQIEIANPVLVSMIPLASFVVFRRAFDSRIAALGALLVAFVHPFYFQLPAGGRAAMPVLFLTLMAGAMTDGDLDPVLRKGLMIGFAAGLVTAHYGASYFVMAALVVALVMLLVAKVVEPFVRQTGTKRTQPDGGRETTLIERLFGGGRRPRMLSAVVVILYVVMTYAWYMYTFGGKKFTRFFTRVYTALSVFLTEGFTFGGTANRLARNYGTVSIQLSKILYIALALLTAVGFLAVYLRWLVDDGWSPEGAFEEYVALASGLLLVFSLTFVFQDIWGGGRPMALTFSLTAVFAVVGARSLGAATQRIGAGLADSLGLGSKRSRRERGVSFTVFAVVLATLLVLNTGVAAATVFGGYAPSNVPVQERIISSDAPGVGYVEYRTTDTATYVWLRNHARSGSLVFGDPLTRELVTDWYVALIAADVDPSRAASFEWETDLTLLDGHDGAAYTVLSGHNVKMRTLLLPGNSNYAYQRNRAELSRVESGLTTQNRIYSTGKSAVYISPS